MLKILGNIAVICNIACMEIDIKNLPKSYEEIANIIHCLQQSLHQNQNELAEYKVKYAGLLKEIRLAKQRHFAPSSEKNILQPDMFDEAGIELPEDVKEQLVEPEVEVKSQMRAALKIIYLADNQWHIEFLSFVHVCLVWLSLVAFSIVIEFHYYLFRRPEYNKVFHKCSLLRVWALFQ